MTTRTEPEAAAAEVAAGAFGSVRRSITAVWWPRRRIHLAVAAVVVVGLGLRLWVAALPLGSFDGDEATTGLMVRGILHGHFYVYMAGQNYNGALEQYLQAIVWAIAPQNVWTLRSVDFALYVVTAVVVFRTAVRYFPQTWQRLAALGVFCLGPYFNVWKGIHSHGSYSAAQLVAAASLLIAADVKPDAAKLRRAIFLLGLAAGLCLWLAWTAFIVVLPACAWAIPALRHRAATAGYAVVGFLLGAAPAIGDAVARGRFPGLGGSQPHRSLLQRLGNLWEPLAREFVGLGYRYGRPGLPFVIQQITLMLVVAAVAVAFVRRRRALTDTLRGRWGERRPADVLLLVPLTACAAYATSRYAWWTGEPRYLFATYPALALAVVAMLPPSRWRFAGAQRHSGAQRRSVAVLAGAVAAGLAATSSVATIAAHSADGPAAEIGCLHQVAAGLQRLGIDDVYSDYWTGMPLQLVAGDRLVVAPVRGGRRKFLHQRTSVDSMPAVYYLAGHLPDPMNESGDDVAKVRGALAAHGISARQTPLACTVLFGPFRPPLRPWQIGLGLAVDDPRS